MLGFMKSAQACRNMRGAGGGWKKRVCGGGARQGLFVRILLGTSLSSEIRMLLSSK